MKRAVYLLGAVLASSLALAWAQGSSPTDPQIAAIVVTANQVDIDAGKLHLTPEGNATSESLKQGGDQNLATLRGLRGKAFDKAYIDHEVTYHQAVLDAMDKVLVPSAQNAQLKALLVKVRPAFVDHLKHAKMIQSTLAGQ